MKTPRFWQTKNLTSAALLPAAALYRIGAWADRAFTTPQRASLPVISIGNATAGGAGKTPTTLALAAVLQAMGHAPHILTRGYGGANMTAHPVDATDDWHSVGDEALLLARVAPTWVGRERIASARAAAQAGASILLCDDAHQHHALHKDISILVIDGPFGIGNGRLLPAGPLREPFTTALARADAVVMIGEDAQQLAAHIPCPVFNATLEPTADIEALRHERWLAFAGIGRPEKFFDTLRGLNIPLVGTRAFTDHHAYTQDELHALAREAAEAGARLITTEKDAVKLPAPLRAQVMTLPVCLRLADELGLRNWLASQITPHKPS